jgi:hypothetical protein
MNSQHKKVIMKARKENIITILFQADVHGLMQYYYYYLLPSSTTLYLVFGKILSKTGQC